VKTQAEVREARRGMVVRKESGSFMVWRVGGRLVAGCTEVWTFGVCYGSGFGKLTLW